MPGDQPGFEDVFVYDTLNGEFTKVSVSSEGVDGNYHSFAPVLSADGRFVAFCSDATNLVADDTTTGIWDVFLHDRQTGETIRVNVSSDGAEANAGVHVPGAMSICVSTDGDVAFESPATNLVPDDTNDRQDIFVHDRQTGETTRVSVASDGTEGDIWGSSFRTSLGTGGRYVAFDSDFRNLVSDDTNGGDDVFIHDTITGETRRASIRSDGSEGFGDSWNPSLSGDGLTVVFNSKAGLDSVDVDNSETDVYLHVMLEVIFIDRFESGDTSAWSGTQ